MAIEPFFLLIILPLAGAPVVYLAGRLYAISGGERHTPAGWLALALLAACLVPLWQVGTSLQASGAQEMAVAGIALRFDGLSLLVSAVALGLGITAVLFSLRYLHGELHAEKYYAMLLTMIGAINGLACAADLFNLWVWFEVMAVSSYLLVMFYRDEPASLEAGVKYVVQSAVGSALVLLGVALTLAHTGELQLEKIAAAAPSPMLLAAGGLFLAGFGVKAALAPLHTWLPDAHSQAPSPISALLSGIVIEAGLVAMLRALGPLSIIDARPEIWGGMLIAAGAFNMLVGNLMALRQTVVKRMLAYSSLAHMGYMLLGLGLALMAGQAAGAQGGAFHLLNHALMKGLAFLAVGMLMYVIAQPLNGSDSIHLKSQPLTIRDMSGASTRYPLAALALTVAVLGLGGLPPLAGFMSKWQIFTAGFGVHSALAAGVVIFAALNSVLSLGYYAPLVSAIYRREPSPAIQNAGPAPMSMLAPLVIMAGIVIALGLWPNLAAGLTTAAGDAILAAFGL